MSKKLAASSSPPKGPVAFKSINVRRLTIRLWAWKVFCFVKKKRNDLHKKQTKIGTMLMFTKYSEGIAEALIEKSNYVTSMFDAVFGHEEIASLEWESVVQRLRAFEDEEGLPNTVPFMTNFSPMTLTVQVASTISPKPFDVTLSSDSDPKAMAAETIVQHDLPHEELDHIISTLQHELLPLVRGDVTARREMLVNFQRWLITMQNLASKYDDTQCKLLKMAQRDEPIVSAAPNKASSVKPSSNKLASSFYKQLVEARRKLEELESQIERLKDAVGPVEDTSAGPEKMSRLQVVTEAVLAPTAGSRGRRASVSVRSMLDAAASKPAMKQTKTVFAKIVEEDEDDEQSSERQQSATNGHRETPKNKIDDVSKNFLYQKAENDKATLIGENLSLRDRLMNSANFEDSESRKIVSELKLWEQERDALETQIEQHEDYINSLRSRISNYQSGKVRNTLL